MAKPPRTRQKLSVEARAELGMPRQCESCGEFKQVSEKTYALSTRGHRGWHTICRVCQGVAASELPKATGMEAPRNLGKTDTHSLIEEMYLLHQSNQNPVRVEQIGADLAQRVKWLHDNGNDRESFELFIDIVKPLIAGWMEPGLIHDDIKKGLLSEHLRVLVIATRYSAKSTLTAIYVAWRIFLDPLIKVMVISRGSKLAARMLRSVRRVIMANCPMLAHLCPNEECLDNAEQFQTPQALTVITGGATLTSLGMGSNLPGFRADLTIGDDVEGPADDTPEKVQQLEEDLNELHMINPKGRKIMLGTYQSEFSVYAKLADLSDDLGNPVWELHRACMFEEDEDNKTILSRWPGMFSDQDALDWRRSVTTRAWRLHAMLIADPSILHERPLKIADLPVLDWSPTSKHFPLYVELTSEEADVPRWSAPKGDKWHVARPMGDTASLVGITMAVDPASGLAGRDAIGVAVLGITQAGFAYILHLEGVRAAEKSLARRRVAQIARNFGATHLIIEELADGLFGETLEGELVQLGYPMSVEKVTTGGQQKGRRIIESLGPPMGAGRVIILDSVARSDHGGEFVNQMVRISYDGRTGKAKDHDDIVDALAHAVSREKASLISDVADNRAAHGQAKLDRWRGVPLREGGLGAFDEEEYPDSRRLQLFGEQDLVEAMLEEDEVIISMRERRDRLQEIVNDDLRSGRGADQGMINKIKTLTRQLKELQELSVL
jgi:hypothetical protein